MDLTRWMELVLAILVLLGDFWAGMRWEAHRTRPTPTRPLNNQGPPRRSA